MTESISPEHLAAAVDGLENRSSLEPQYILTRIRSQVLAFPFKWVAELMMVDQAHLLALPFYPAAVMGVTYYQGHLVPLLSTAMLLSEDLGTYRYRLVKGQLMVIRLGSLARQLTGVGLVVDNVQGRIRGSELAVASNATLFTIDLVPPEIWVAHTQVVANTSHNRDYSEGSDSQDPSLAHANV